MKTHNKRLYKDKDNKVFLGVMGGLGEYFDVDPVLFRVAFVVLSAFAALVPGVVAYILMAVIMPQKPEHLRTEVQGA